MALHTYIVQFVYDHGNGWAIINSPSPGYIEGTLKRQSRFQNITLVSYKEIEYFGNETSLICEGGVTTLDKTPYDIAVENGYVGSEQEWLESLKGQDGQDGTNGSDGADATINGVSTLLIEAGDNVRLNQTGNRLVISVPSNVINYAGLNNLPKIEGITLEGDMSLFDLGIAPMSQVIIPGISTLFGGFIDTDSRPPIGNDDEENDNKNKYYYLTKETGDLPLFEIYNLPNNGKWKYIHWNPRDAAWDWENLNSYTSDAIDLMLLHGLYPALGFEVFEPTYDYVANDIVVYEDLLYTFTNPHSGEWDENDVSLINLNEFINYNLNGLYDALNSSKADKHVPSASGNIATLDSVGNLDDSGYKPSDFVTRVVNDLTNYYLKSETYTQAEVNALIGAINEFSYEVAASTSAVTNPQSNVLYLIGPTGSGSDRYEEYVYPNSTTGWTKIGDTSIDLSGYATTSSLTDVLRYSTQSFTDAQKLQARTNIGATAPEIFWATYGTTTASEINTAVGAGKLVVCRYSSYDFILSETSQSYYYFSYQAGSTGGYLRVSRTTSEWTTVFTTLQLSSFKVTSFQSTPDDTHYPSEKLVSDSLATKENKIPIVSSSGTTLSASTGNYYRFDSAVGTLAITLSHTNDAYVQQAVFSLTTDTTTNITFATATSGETIYYADTYLIEASKTYEINALWNGASWNIASINLILPTP